MNIQGGSQKFVAGGHPDAANKLLEGFDDTVARALCRADGDDDGVAARVKLARVHDSVIHFERPLRLLEHRQAHFHRRLLD